jgi:hypothetical protein
MKQDTPTNSAERVKAFRERLDSQFKRVEAYVTEDEKSRIQAVRTQEAVTMDIAVAGLVRLGLERYEELRAQDATAPTGPLSKGPFMLSGAVGAALEATPFTAGAASLNGFVGASASAFSTQSLSERDASHLVTSSEPAENPVARFFKKRKEIINE